MGDGILVKLDMQDLKLFIYSSHMAQMFSHVKRESPQEACGLVAGVHNSSLEVFPITNVLKSVHRYRMDPQEQINALIQIEQNKMDLIGIYHSHPKGPENPSVTDLKESYYPEISQLIFSRVKNKWKCRAYKLRGFEYQEVKILKPK